MLDCFCGLGGASEGFNREGFECIGVDIVNVGYPFKLIIADLQDLQGKDFKDYDVVWGSPPCRDFSYMTPLGKLTWKTPPNEREGLKLIVSFLRFIKESNPKIWIMENNPKLAKHLLHIKPRIHKTMISRTMQRSFWGNFPLFLMPMDLKKKMLVGHRSKTKRTKTPLVHQGVKRKWHRAKIPLACSLAFAKACKEKLLNDGEE